MSIKEDPGGSRPFSQQFNKITTNYRAMGHLMCRTGQVQYSGNTASCKFCFQDKEKEEQDLALGEKKKKIRSFWMASFPSAVTIAPHSV